MTIKWAVLRVLLAARWRITGRALWKSVFWFGSGLQSLVLSSTGVVGYLYTLALIEQSIDRGAASGGVPVRNAGTALVLVSQALFSLLTWMSIRPLQERDGELALVSPLPVSAGTYQVYRLVSTTAHPLAVPGLVGAYVAMMTFGRGWGIGWPILVVGVAVALHLWTMGLFLPLEAAVRRWGGAKARRLVLATLERALALVGLGAFVAGLMFEQHSTTLVQYLSWLAATPVGQAAVLCATPRPLPELLAALAMLVAPAALFALLGAGCAAAVHAGALPDAVLDTSEIRPRFAGARARTPGAWSLLTPLQRLWVGGPAGRVVLPVVLGTTLTLFLIGLAYHVGEPHIRRWADQLYLAASVAPGVIPLLAGCYAALAIGTASRTLERATPFLLAQPLTLSVAAGELARLEATLQGAVLVALYATAAGLGIGPWPDLAVPLAAQLLLAWWLIDADYSEALATTGPERWGAAGRPPLQSCLGRLFLWVPALGPWFTLQVLVYVGLMTLAVRQDLAIHEPRVMDPDAVPPAGIRLSGAMFSVQLFFGVQGALLASLSATLPEIPAPPFAFAIAGLFVSLGTILWIRHTRPFNAPRLAWTSARDVLSEALPLALPLAALAMAYRYAATYGPGGTDGTGAEPAVRIALLLMSVLCAPPVEELLFRGLLYAGLRRNLDAAPSVVLSALMFATLHPPFGFVPIFAVGVATALARERTGGLAVPIAIHAFYNLIVVGIGVSV